MPASLLASFLVFIITGIYTLFFMDIAAPGQSSGGIAGHGVTPMAQFLIGGTLLANAIYFYYFEAYAEIDEAEHQRLSGKTKAEWGLRVANHAILLSLWFALERNLVLFLILWIGFYAVLLVWDFVTRDRPGPGSTGRPFRELAKWDACGLVLSIFFLAVVFSLREIAQEGQYKSFIEGLVGRETLVLLLGIFCALYAILAWTAIRRLKGFHLLDHFKRSALR